jgi:hypothetical protein
MRDPLALAAVAGLELIVLTLVTAVYYYEAIRGIVQQQHGLAIAAERMFGVGSVLSALTATTIGVLVWYPESAWAIGFAVAVITLVLLVVVVCCVCWALGSFVHPRYYLIPWKAAGRAQPHNPVG